MSSVIGDEGLEDTPGDEGLEDTPGERAGNRKRRKITDIDHGGVERKQKLFTVQAVSLLVHF